MDITIDKNLQKLRASRGNTQEDLAAFLCISSQAVSKWERGESIPDVALLPRIASYYDVTVDELLGVGEIRKQEKIEEYMITSRKLNNQGFVKENLKLWREAQREYPNDHKVLHKLMYALNLDDEKERNEIITIAERLLRESTDQYYRGDAIQLLCFAYANADNYEKAREYAQMPASMYVSSEALLSHVLKGDELKNHCYCVLLEHLDLIDSTMLSLCNDKNYARYGELHEIYLKLMDVFFDDGFYGFYACRAVRHHHSLARINLWDEEKCRTHLEAAVKFAKQYDGLSGEYTYTSSLMNGYKDNMNNTSKNYIETQCGLLKKWLQDSHFDRVREKDWFKAVEASVSES